MVAQVTQHNAAYKLFHYPFRVSIPSGYLVSQAEIAAIGIPTSGNAALDRREAQRPVEISITIDRMAEFFAQGITLEFESIADIVRIYDIILEHITDFQVAIDARVMMPEIPWDDLKLLDEFARELFIRARGRIAERTATSLALSSLESKVHSIVRPGATKQDTSNVFQEIATSTHDDHFEALQKQFKGRFQGWR